MGAQNKQIYFFSMYERQNGCVDGGYIVKVKVTIIKVQQLRKPVSTNKRSPQKCCGLHFCTKKDCLSEPRQFLLSSFEPQRFCGAPVMVAIFFRAAHPLVLYKREVSLEILNNGTKHFTAIWNFFENFCNFLENYLSCSLFKWFPTIQEVYSLKFEITRLGTSNQILPLFFYF